MSVQIHLILLLTIVLIIHLYSPDRVSETKSKIIAYAIFLSYYITSGNGKNVMNGLIGSLLTWYYLLYLECNCSGTVLYWGKLLWYGVLWYYAFSTYPAKQQTVPILMTVMVLLLATTDGPWQIQWCNLGSNNPFKDCFFGTYL